MTTWWVAPAMAAPSTMGDGRYPSSAPWCSARYTVENPQRSPHALISTAARYSAGAGAPNAGARMSYRSASSISSPPLDLLVHEAGVGLRAEVQDVLGVDEHLLSCLH